MPDGSIYRDAPTSVRYEAARRLRGDEGDGFATGAGVLGTAIGTAIGAAVGQPMAGAAIGSTAGGQVGRVGEALIEDDPARALGAAIDPSTLLAVEHARRRPGRQAVAPPENPLRDIRRQQRFEMVGD